MTKKHVSNNSPSTSPIVIRDGKNMLVAYDRCTWKCSLASLGQFEEFKGTLRSVSRLQKVKHKSFTKLSARMHLLGECEKEAWPLLVVFLESNQLRFLIDDQLWACSWDAALREPMLIQLGVRAGKSPVEEEPSKPSKERVRGGVSTTVEGMRSALSRSQVAGLQADASKAAALLTLSEMLRNIFEQTLAGDQECGYFCGELKAWLTKNCKPLQAANPLFRKTAANIESAYAKRAVSRLRNVIEDIVRQAQQAKEQAQIIKRAPIPEKIKKAFGVEVDDTLSQLPELDENTAAEWTEKYVYPHFQKLARAGLLPASVTEMRKAQDKNGKVQASNVRKLIRQTMDRIARQPRMYYFQSAVLPN